MDLDLRSTSRTMRGRTAALPGLAVVAVVVVVAELGHRWVAGAPPVVLAAALGTIVSAVGGLPKWSGPGVRMASKPMLRVAVALLGFRLLGSDILRIGATHLLVVVIVVGITFVGTRRVGARLGVGPELSLLIASGFAVCGASAVAAMSGAVEADEDDTAIAIALVTLCGTGAVLLMPMVGPLVHLEGADLGAWIGASVHDVAQVVAAGSAMPRPSAVIDAAVVVKLVRVLMLAPLVLAVSRARRPAAGTRRPAAVPLFIVAFGAAMALRSSGAVPTSALRWLGDVQAWLLVGAVFGLASTTNLGRLRRLGVRPIALAFCSWLLVGTTAWAGVRLASG